MRYETNSYFGLMYESEDSFSHHGVKGMKWGQHIFGKKKIGSRKRQKQILKARKKKIKAQKKAAKSERKLEKKNAKIQRKEADRILSIEERKDKVLKSRSAQELFDNAPLFTDAELNVAYNRLRLEKNIKDMTPKKVSKGKKFVDGFIEFSKTANSATENGIKAWNSMAKVHNAMYPKDPAWTIVRDDQKKDK